MRYYESEGLLIEVSRDKYGVRQYSEQDWLAIDRIIHLRKLGASIKEIKKFLIDESEITRETIEERRQFLLQLKTNLDQEILEIETKKQYLNQKLTRFNQVVEELKKGEAE